MICTPHPISFGDHIENEMDGACSMNGGENRCIQGSSGETRGKEAIWETQTLMGG